jgi:hypothetical protein
MNRRILLVVIVTLVVLSLWGCNLPTRESTVELLPTEPPVEVVELEVVEPTEPPPPSPTEVPEIVHVSMPAQGDGKEQTIHDQLSQNTAPEKRAYGGDEYLNGRWERPFTATDMEYLPFIDLVQTNLIRDENNGWLYADLITVEPASNGGERKLIYGIEMDRDLDGRGDVLILADAPESTEWTTNGVRVWQDLNANVGATEPMKSDAPEQNDGYEVKTFDEGIGDDPDLAWVRISSGMSNKVEFAFKLELMDIGEEYYIFLWGAWAFAEDAHPDWFDHHDKFTLAEAGSPLKDNEEYPLKAFYGADNTCRALSGMEPTVQLLGMCPLSVPQASGEGRCPAEMCCSLTATHGFPCPQHWDYNLCACVDN